MFIIYPYKMGSNSAKELARALNTKRVYPDGRYNYKPNHQIINWGNSYYPNFDREGIRWINNPDNVDMATNKLTTLQLLQTANVSIPEFTTDIDLVRESGGALWVLRRLLKSHSGRGIELHQVTNPNDIPNVPLFTKYIKKSAEYRFHVMNREVIDVQQKRKRRDYDGEHNYQVRNHHTGWVYTRENVNYHTSLVQLAIDAVNAIGLDFGAVDIIWNDHYQRGYVLEVNTAPGLEGATIDIYTRSFIKHYRGV